MKRVLALLLCLLCVAGCFAACKKEEPTVVDPVTNPDYTGAATVTRSGETVDITFPLSLLEKKYQKNLTRYCNKNGYQSAQTNTAQNTVTVTMLKSTYDLQLVEKGMDTISLVYGLLEGGGYPFFQKIEPFDEDLPNQDQFKEITIVVDGNAFNAAGDAAEELTAALAQSCMLYQVYTTKNNYVCKVIAKDAQSGDTVFKKTYRSNNKKMG